MKPKEIFQKIDDYRWKIPKSFKAGMLTDALLYASEDMLPQIVSDNAYLQMINVAFMPGIAGNSLAMPDINLGYGFPIGGVAAFDPAKGGVISPGGVGYDINCGIRLLRTDLELKEIKDKISDIVDRLAAEVPSGVGKGGVIELSKTDMDKVMVQGSKWAVSHGFGEENDILQTESEGSLPGADPSLVSQHAKDRGTDQAGTLGSGNHFLEVQVVEEVYDEKTANQFGLLKGQITIMVHSGSRGLGHQVCADYIKVMNRAVQKYNIHLPDRQLCCAPINSPEGKDYYAAMAGAANFAWCNRQILTHWTREVFSKTMRSSPGKPGISLVYDVAHNIAKMENGLCVHRKGATRAFPGQPVLIPGDMGRYSYVLVGTERAMEETWGSVCHGAGRRMSRAQAMRSVTLKQLMDELEAKGVIVRSASRKGLIEEAPEAYKDVREVVDVVHNAGLARKVCRMKPLGVVKG
ncbi:MAG: RtcB family protein [Candidatus Margulisbacteria bacterium]|nr:RtcB family protein [Candidatus Margulisiibacteriota bacterium]